MWVRSLGRAMLGEWRWRQAVARGRWWLAWVLIAMNRADLARCGQQRASEQDRQVPIMHMRAHHKACSMPVLNTGQHGSCQAVPSHHFP